MKHYFYILSIDGIVNNILFFIVIFTLLGISFNFVFLDYVMLNIHGPEAAFKMRNELNYQGAIIGVTGNALPEDILLFKKNGADDVIIKPLYREKLIEAIQNLHTPDYMI